MSSGSGPWTAIRLVDIHENEPDQCFVLAIAESPDGEGNHLVMMCPLDVDRAHSGNPLDGYCLVTQSGQTYGGIEAIGVVGAGRLQLILSDDAASSLGIQQTNIDVVVERPAKDILALRHAIDRILQFGGESVARLGVEGEEGR